MEEKKKIAAGGADMLGIYDIHRAFRRLFEDFSSAEGEKFPDGRSD